MSDFVIADRPVRREQAGGYLFGARQAWFAYFMTLGLMVFDYVDRQVVVSLFPYLKAEWGLLDSQLGALVSVVSVTVGLFAIPIALLADRYSRVKSIVGMGLIWSLATISSVFVKGYGFLFAARAAVGVGEAGYGSVGAAMIATHFPERMRGALLGGFFACGPLGSVLGVVVGGVIAARWGWQAAFGVVGVPGLVLALLYLLVRDYETVKMSSKQERIRNSLVETVKRIASSLARTPTLLWICIGGAAQLIAVSAVLSWLPSFFNRVHGLAPEEASIKAAVVIMAGAVGSVVWGAAVDRVAKDRPIRRLHAMAVLCVVTAFTLAFAFATRPLGLAGNLQGQLALIALGAFVMTCTVGPIVAVLFDVIHPGARSTGASVLSLFQNLFGLALGPYITGLLSDAWSLEPALMAMPAFCIVAAIVFLVATRTFETDMRKVRVESAG
jgi:MFS family permease